MRDKTHQFIGLALGAVVAILALVGVAVDNWDVWWVVVAVAAVVTGLWWSAGGFLVRDEEDPPRAGAGT